jgi:hypothetical protein
MDLLRCPACGAAIDAHDVHAELGIANCRSCRGVVDLRSRAKARGEVGAPLSFTVEETGDTLQLTWRWWRARHWMQAIFCIAWDSFLIFWYSNTSGSPWIATVFPVAHVAVGVGLTYATIAAAFNRTRITVESGVVTIAHGPIWWWGNRVLAALDVEQIYCTRQARTDSDGDRSETSPSRRG